MSLKMAIASENERERAFDLARLFEETVDCRNWTMPEIDGEEFYEDELESLKKFYDKCKTLSPGLMRVVFGYQVLLDNCCDKSADHLKFSDALQGKIEAGERSIARMMVTLKEMNLC